MQAKNPIVLDQSATRRPVSAREYALIAALAIATTAGLAGVGQGQGSPSTSSNAAQSSDAGATSTAAPQESLAEAARKAKAQKAQAAAAKPAKVFTNDNLPTDGVISTVGTTPSGKTDATAAATAGDQKGEAYWRGRFADLNKKLSQDQAELDVMQRELGQLNLHNYSDPVQAMQQGYSQGDIQKKTDDIDAKKKAIEADQQAISDAEDEMRKAGGDSGWAR
jgi:hypothetical protein